MAGVRIAAVAMAVALGRCVVPARRPVRRNGQAPDGHRVSSQRVGQAREMHAGWCGSAAWASTGVPLTVETGGFFSTR